MNKEMKNILMVAGVFLGIAAFLGYLVYSKNESLKAMKATNASLVAEITGYKTKYKQKEEKEKTLQQLENAVKEYVKILPDPLIATEEEIIRVFSDKAKRANVDMLKYEATAGGKTRRGRTRRRGLKQKKKDFEELTVKFDIQGSLSNFVRFLGYIERHESFLQVQSFGVSPIKSVEDSEVGNLINGSVFVSTFRYNAKK